VATAISNARPYSIHATAFWSGRALLGPVAASRCGLEVPTVGACSCQSAGSRERGRRMARHHFACTAAPRLQRAQFCIRHSFEYFFLLSGMNGHRINVCETSGKRGRYSLFSFALVSEEAHPLGKPFFQACLAQDKVKWRSRLLCSPCTFLWAKHNCRLVRNCLTCCKCRWVWTVRREPNMFWGRTCKGM
jgi:hypothetical protein